MNVSVKENYSRMCTFVLVFDAGNIEHNEHAGFYSNEHLSWTVQYDNNV